MYGREALRILRERQAAPQEDRKPSLLDQIPPDAPMDDATICVWNGERLNFPSMTAASAMGFSHSKISLCISGKRRTHKGYRWEAA